MAASCSSDGARSGAAGRLASHRMTLPGRPGGSMLLSARRGELLQKKARSAGGRSAGSQWQVASRISG